MIRNLFPHTHTQIASRKSLKLELVPKKRGNKIKSFCIFVVIIKKFLILYLILPKKKLFKSYILMFFF
jgi:hypothetical protein